MLEKKEHNGKSKKPITGLTRRIDIDPRTAVRKGSARGTMWQEVRVQGTSKGPLFNKKKRFRPGKSKLEKHASLHAVGGSRVIRSKNGRGGGNRSQVSGKRGAFWVPHICEHGEKKTRGKFFEGYAGPQHRGGADEEEPRKKLGGGNSWSRSDYS